MYDLFLDPKVLDYSEDRYELILYTLRWARALKGKGSPEPMQDLIEKALKDIVEGRITKEEILSTKTVAAPVVVEEAPAVVSLADEEAPKAKLADEEDEDKKKTKKKKAK
jgi:DNA-directed RNA polymerase subunit K/omega